MITLEGVVRKVQIFLHILVIHKGEKNMRVERISILPTTPPLGSRWVDICVISYSEGVLIDVMWEAVDELDQLLNL